MDRVVEEETDKGGGGDATGIPKEDPCHPLDLFCEDVWIEVLKFLDGNPRDLLNLGETCSYFRKLLDMGIPGVRGAGQGSCRLEEVLPLVIRCVEHEADILALRQVCRRVGDTTDKVLECRDRVTPRQNLGIFPWLIPPPPRDPGRHESFEWKYFENHHLYLNYWPWPHVQFYSGPTSKPMERFQNYESFLEEQRLARRKGNRAYKVVSKKICAQCPDFFSEEPGPDVPEHETFVQRLLQFFEASKSEEIRSVDMFIYETQEPLGYYDLPRKVVCLVPLLRSLTIFHCDSPIDSLESDYSEEDLQELQAFIDTHPLPVAPNLEKLSLLSSPPFLRQLSIAYGGHLKILEITVTDPSLFLARGGKNKATADYHFPLLEYFRIRLCPHCLPIMLNFRCPSLMSLNVGLCHMLDGCRPVKPLDELSEAISSFPSVSSLYLNLYLRLPESTGHESETEQRNVRKLVVGTCLNSFSTAPSLSCYARLFPNVEEISVMDSVPFPGDRKSLVVDLDLMLLKKGRIRDSTIWREAPQLKVVTLEREGYRKGTRKTPIKFYRPQD